MQIELSNPDFLVVCALVKDAMESNSDATPLLRRVAMALAKAASSSEPMPVEFVARAEGLARLRRLAEGRE